MKSSIFLVLALAGTALAQDDKALASQRDAKLAEGWVKSGGWFSDYGKALAEAKKSGKPILAYFTCTTQSMPYCQKLEAGVFSDGKFPEFSKGYVLYVNITSGLKKDKNQDLLAKKGGKDRFPYMVWLDPDGNVVSDTDKWESQDASRAIPGLDDTGKRIKWYLDVKKKAKDGGNPEKIDALFADVQMDHVKLALAEKTLDGLGALTDEQKTVLEGLRVRDEIKPTIDKMRSKGASDPDIFAAGTKFLAIHKAGRPGPPGGPELEWFWRCLLYEARKEKDTAAFEASIKALKAKFGDSTAPSLYWHPNETYKGFLEEQEKLLGELKAAK